jgi:hypothetical protein
LHFLYWLSKGLVVVHPKRFDKLITSIRTAVDNEVVLVKEEYLSGYTDAFQLAMKFYRFE